MWQYTTALNIYIVLCVKRECHTKPISEHVETRPWVFIINVTNILMSLLIHVQLTFDDPLYGSKKLVSKN